MHQKLEQAIRLSEEKDKLLLGAVHYIYTCVFVFVLKLAFQIMRMRIKISTQGKAAGSVNQLVSNTPFFPSGITPF